MKRRIFSLAAGLLLVLSACAPAAPQSSEELIYPTSHPTCPPTPPPGPYPPPPPEGYRTPPPTRRPFPPAHA